MFPWCESLPDVPVQTLCSAKTLLTLGLFLLFWGWETLAPFFDPHRGRCGTPGETSLSPCSTP